MAQAVDHTHSKKVRDVAPTRALPFPGTSTHVTLGPRLHATYLHTEAASPTSYISNSLQRKNSASQACLPILAPRARIHAL